MKSLPEQKKISLSVAEAADWLGVASATLRRWDRSGRLIPERTSGNQRRYTLDQLKEFKRRKRRQENLFPLTSQPLGVREAEGVGRQAPLAKGSKIVVGIGAIGEGEADTCADDVLPQAPLIKEDLTSAPSGSVSRKLAASQKLHPPERAVKIASLSFLAVSVCLFVAFLIIPNHPRFSPTVEYLAGIFGQEDHRREQRAPSDQVEENILQAATADLNHFFRVNIPSEFDDGVSILAGLSVNNIATLSGGISTNNTDIDAGTGTVTAENIPASIVSGIIAGSGVSVAGTATVPTISNTGVLSLQGSTGALSLTAGSGISISGLKISSTVTSGTTSDSWKSIAVSGQTTLTAGSSTDTLTFAAGTNITLTTTTSSKTLTITSSATSSQWTTTGSDIYYNTGNVGIGTTAPVGRLHVTGDAGGVALVKFNELGTNDIFTASASGTTRLTLSNAGNLNLIGGVYQSGGTSGVTVASASCITSTGGIVTGSGSCPSAANLDLWQQTNGAIYTGNSTVDLLLGATATASAKFAFININSGTPTASISANSGNNATTLTGLGVLSTTNMQALTLGGSTTGEVVLDAGSSLIKLLDDTRITGDLAVNGGTSADITSTTTTATVFNTTATTLNIGGAATTLSLGASSGTTTVNNALAVTGATTLNGNVTLGDAITDSITFTGRVAQDSDLIPIGTTGTNDLGSSTLPWDNLYADNIIAGTTGVSGYWQRLSGFIFPVNLSDDVIIGGNSTSSAKFAVLNINSGTPTASVSAGNAGGAYLSATGTLATTASQNLTIGDSTTTGSVIINPSGNIGIGTTAPSSKLHVAGGVNLSTGNALSINGTSVLNATTLGTGVTASSLTSVGTIATGVWQGTSVKADFGGIGVTTYNQGEILYAGSDNPTALSKLAVGTSGFVLTTGGAAANPSWTDPNSASFGLWQSLSGTIQPKNQTLDLLLGGTATSSARFSVLNINSGTAVASVSGGLNGTNGVALSAGGSLQSLNAIPLTIGGSTTGQVVLSGRNGANNGITLSGYGTGFARISSAGVVTSSAVDLATADVTGVLPIANGGTNKALTLAAGAVAYSDADSFELSAAGNSGEVLTSGGTGAPTWTALATNLTAGVFQILSGTAQPKNQTLDLLLGGTATTSADFAFININSGTPTASISANLALAVPTGNAPAATLDILNNGTFNIRNSPGGDAGVTSRLFIANNGNIGIGTTNPASVIDVNKEWPSSESTNLISSFTSYADSSRFVIRRANGTVASATQVLSGDVMGNLNFRGYHSGGAFATGGSAAVTATAEENFTSTAWGGRLTFSTVPIGSTTLTERVRIDSSGNVGIGTTAPVGKLHVQGDAGGIALVKFNELGTNDIFTASAAGTTRFVIRNDGNVGIGTNLPTALLDIAGATGASTSGILTFRGTTDPSIDFINGENLNIRSSVGGDAGLTSRLFINGNTGNVGIGTTAPNDKLEIAATSANLGLRIANTGNTASDFSAIRFYQGGSEQGVIFTNQNDLYIRTNGPTGEDLILVDNGGNVGIGTTAPVGRLHIAGDAGGVALVKFNETGTNDIFTASASGTTRLTLSNGGNLNLIGGVYQSGGTSGVAVTASCVTTTGGIVTASAACPVGSNSWTVANGAVFPNQASVLDVLIGGTATTSADFAFINVNSGTPVASISGNIVLGTGDTTIRTIGTTRQNTLQLGDSNTGHLSFAPTGAVAMTITNGGNVGIGTTAPAALLSIANGADDPLNYGKALQITNLSGNRQQIAFIRNGNNVISAGYNGASSVWGFGAGNTTDSGFSPTYLSIDLGNSGNVGIGTTAPDGKLHALTASAGTVTANTAADELTLENSTDGGLSILTPAANVGWIMFGSPTSNARGALSYSHASDFMRFDTAGAEKMRIDTNGNVGIGTTAPSLALLNSASILATGAAQFSSIVGAGLATDCDSSSSKLQWDSATKRFVCGTDDQTVSVYKTADESITNDATLTTDTDLQFAIAANETWEYRISASFVVNANTDLQYNISVPTGATCEFNSEDINISGAAVNGGNGGWPCGTAAVVTIANNNTINVELSGFVANGGTAGTFGFQWAQNTSGAGALQLNAGSTLVAWKHSGVDLAEVYYTKDHTIDAGTIVSMDSSLTAGVKKADKAYAKDVMGIVSTKPGLVLTDGAGIKEGSPRLVSLVGRVPVKVSSINGPINPGDPIVPSNIPGVGMRATRPGFIVGKALTGYDNPDPYAVGTVMIYVKETWYEPDVYITETGDINIFADAIEPMVEKFAIKKGEEEIDRKGLFSDVFTGNLNAGKVDAQSLTVGGVNILDLFDSNLKDSTQSAALESKVDVLGSRVDSLTDHLSILEQLAQQTASNAALLHDLINSSLGVGSASASLEQTIANLDIQSATISGELNVLGRATLSDLGVTGVITNGVLSIHGLEGEINTIGESLKLQPLGLERVEIMAGKIVIDTDGSIKTKSDITTEGTVTAKKYKVSDTDQDAKSVGVVTIPSGQITIDVDTTALTDESHMFVTPERPITASAKRKDEDTFTISLQNRIDEDLKIHWWIIN